MIFGFATAALNFVLRSWPVGHQTGSPREWRRPLGTSGDRRVSILNK